MDPRGGSETFFLCMFIDFGFQFESPERTFWSLFGTVCLRFFHNRVRVLNHIKYRSSVCRLNLTLAGPLISEEQAEVLDEGCREQKRILYAKGLRAHSATDPCFRLCGPIPLPLIIDGSKHSKICHILGFGHNHY